MWVVLFLVIVLLLMWYSRDVFPNEAKMLQNVVDFAETQKCFAWPVFSRDLKTLRNYEFKITTFSETNFQTVWSSTDGEMLELPNYKKLQIDLGQMLNEEKVTGPILKYDQTLNLWTTKPTPPVTIEVESKTDTTNFTLKLVFSNGNETTSYSTKVGGFEGAFNGAMWIWTPLNPCTQEGTFPLTQTLLHEYLLAKRKIELNIRDSVKRQYGKNSAPFSHLKLTKRKSRKGAKSKAKISEPRVEQISISELRDEIYHERAYFKCDANLKGDVALCPTGFLFDVPTLTCVENDSSTTITTIDCSDPTMDGYKWVSDDTIINGSTFWQCVDSKAQLQTCPDETPVFRPYACYPPDICAGKETGTRILESSNVGYFVCQNNVANWVDCWGLTVAKVSDDNYRCMFDSNALVSKFVWGARIRYNPNVDCNNDPGVTANFDDGTFGPLATFALSANSSACSSVSTNGIAQSWAQDPLTTLAGCWSFDSGPRTTLIWTDEKGRESTQISLTDENKITEKVTEKYGFGIHFAWGSKIMWGMPASLIDGLAYPPVQCGQFRFMVYTSKDVNLSYPLPPSLKVNSAANPDKNYISVVITWANLVVFEVTNCTILQKEEDLTVENPNNDLDYSIERFAMPRYVTGDLQHYLDVIRMPFFPAFEDFKSDYVPSTADFDWDLTPVDAKDPRVAGIKNLNVILRDGNEWMFPVDYDFDAGDANLDSKHPFFKLPGYLSDKGMNKTQEFYLPLHIYFGFLRAYKICLVGGESHFGFASRKGPCFGWQEYTKV